MIVKLIGIENIEYCDPHPRTTQYLKIWRHMILKRQQLSSKCLKILVNLQLLFARLAVAIAVFFDVSFPSVSPYPVVKRSGRPAGRHEGKLSI